MTFLSQALFGKPDDGPDAKRMRLTIEVDVIYNGHDGDGLPFTSPNQGVEFGALMTQGELIMHVARAVNAALITSKATGRFRRIDGLQVVRADVVRERKPRKGKGR